MSSLCSVFGSGVLKHLVVPLDHLLASCLRDKDFAIHCPKLGALYVGSVVVNFGMFILDKSCYLLVTVL